ncbi:hypothetical protein [Herbidospora cretacea]|uniref:hypothetical protein n=1 Tax=Herbidospora cretacea TaxID=28444 RepID=UPI0005533533|nr:hypothetical protein [Herbidospora cretacea]
MGLLSNLLLPGRLRTGPTVVVPAKTKPEAILEIVRLADPQAELDGADVLAAATRIHDAVELTPDLQKKLGLDGEEKLWAHRVVAERPLPVDYYDKLLAAGLAYRLGGYCLCEGSADDPAEDVELEYVVYLPAVEESELTPALEKILGTEEDTEEASPDAADTTASDTEATEATERADGHTSAAAGDGSGQADGNAEPEDVAAAAAAGDESDAAKSESDESADGTRPASSEGAAGPGSASGEAAVGSGAASSEGAAGAGTASGEAAVGSGAASSEGAAGAGAGSGEAAVGSGAASSDGAAGAGGSATGDEDESGEVAAADDTDAAESDAGSVAAPARRSRWSSDGVYEAAGFRVAVTPVHRFPAAVAGLMPYATEVVRIAVTATEELDGDARMLDPGNVALALGTALDGPVVDHWGFQVFEPADLLPPRSV